MRHPNRAVSRSVVIAVIIVIVVIALGGTYAVLSSNINNPATTVTTSSSNGTSSQSVSATTSLGASSSSSSSHMSSASVPSNQNLVIELPTSPGSGPDVFASTTSTYFEDLSYENLFTYNQTSSSPNPIPWLATGYTVNSNATIWTLTLRQGVKYTDGTSFNATGVKAGFDDVILSGFRGAGQIPIFIRGAIAYINSNHNAANQTTFLNNDGITVLNPYTIQFSLAKPEADFLTYVTSPLYNYYSVSPSALAANGGVVYGVGSTWMQTHTAGTGPYVLQSYSPTTHTLVYVANPNWWAIAQLGMKQPFDKITVNIVSNPATEELDLRTGGANLISLPVTNVFDFANRSLWQSNQTLSSDAPGVSLWGPYASSAFATFILNSQIHTSSGALASVQPFQNAELRAAINQAWNESFFIQSDLNGLAITNPSVLVQGQLGYSNYPSIYPYNLTQSKMDIQAACQQLGCSPANPLQISLVATADTISELAGSLLTSTINSMQAGIVLNLQPLAISAKISTFLAGSFGILLYEQPSLTGDPLSQPLAQMGTGIALKSGFDNTTVTALINQAAATSNTTERAQLYAQIDLAIAQGGQFVKIDQVEDVFATNGVNILPENPWLLNSLPSIFALTPG